MVVVGGDASTFREIHASTTGGSCSTSASKEYTETYGRMIVAPEALVSPLLEVWYVSAGVERESINGATSLHGLLLSLAKISARQDLDLSFLAHLLGRVARDSASVM
jgi:hypothetical protein